MSYLFIETMTIFKYLQHEFKEKMHEVGKDIRYIAHEANVMLVEAKGELHLLLLHNDLGKQLKAAVGQIKCILCEGEFMLITAGTKVMELEMQKASDGIETLVHKRNIALQLAASS